MMKIKKIKKLSWIYKSLQVVTLGTDNPYRPYPRCVFVLGFVAYVSLWIIFTEGLYAIATFNGIFPWQTILLMLKTVFYTLLILIGLATLFALYAVLVEKLGGRRENTWLFQEIEFVD